jgi:hypothetical protein
VVFLDRLDAGRQLGERLSSLRCPEVVVLGIRQACFGCLSNTPEGQPRSVSVVLRLSDSRVPQ